MRVRMCGYYTADHYNTMPNNKTSIALGNPIQMSCQNKSHWRISIPFKIHYGFSILNPYNFLCIWNSLNQLQYLRIYGYLVQLEKKQHKKYFSEHNNIQLGKHLLTPWKRILVQLQICKNSTLGTDTNNYIFTDQIYTSTVEPHLTVTSLVRSPHHYGHPCSVPNCIPQCKLAPVIWSPLN